MFVIEKKLKHFSAAHRIVNGYQGKCRHLHGHNYSGSVVIAAKHLNEYGFVIDFDDIKEHLDNWVQSHWDHATLVSTEDKALLQFVLDNKQHHFILPDSENSSSENLAKFLFYKFNEIINELKYEVTLVSTTVSESDTAQATFSHE